MRAFLNKLMGLAVVLGCLVSWVGMVMAGPAVIVAARAEVLRVPSESAGAVEELKNGDPVCVLDRSNYAGPVIRRAGWLAIRLAAGIGYVPAEAVDVTAPAPEVRDCGAVANMSAVQPRESAVVLRGLPVAAGHFTPMRPARFLFGLGSGVSWLNQQSTAQHHIGGSGVTVNATLAFTIYDVFMVSGLFEAAFPEDHASYNQVVVPVGNGEMPTGSDSRLVDSTLSIMSYGVAAGLRTPFLALANIDHRWVGGAVFVQYGSAEIHGKRSISNCIDCRKDGLEMPGGRFWQAGFDVIASSSKRLGSIGLALSYLRYGAGAGIDSEIRGGISLWLP